MGTALFGSVDSYLEGFSAHAREVLMTVREAIRSALPEAEEGIAYNMPSYKINGTAVIFFAGWKKNYSIYPASDALIQIFAKELDGFTVDKSTIRFPYAMPVPVELIKRIARFRALERA